MVWRFPLWESSRKKLKIDKKGIVKIMTDSILLKSGLPTTIFYKLINCRNCQLSNFRKNVVPGKGSIPADLLFIGEAPGRSENYCGLPFEGISGKFLHMMIRQSVRVSSRNLGAVLTMPRIYITNTILCRPCDSLQGGNRKPSSHEVLACRYNLNLIFQLVNPKKVVFVGKESTKYFGKDFPNATTILHPAFLLRDGGKGSPFFNQTIITLSKIMEEYGTIYKTKK